jgi:hypothetical protein
MLRDSGLAYSSTYGVLPVVVPCHGLVVPCALFSASSLGSQEEDTTLMPLVMVKVVSFGSSTLNGIKFVYIANKNVITHCYYFL